MGPAALNRALLCALLGALALPLRADIQGEEQVRRLARADNSIWQAVFGHRVVREAEKQLGRPYIWGAKDGAEGFDCSGLTAYVYGTLGVELAQNAIGQYQQGVSIERAGLLAGDLVFFSGQGSPLHVGIYAGDGQFLHAPGAGKVIQMASIDSTYFKDHYIGARRLTPALDEARRQRGLSADLRSAFTPVTTTSTPLYKEKAP
jgi:hypothetical protein